MKNMARHLTPEEFSAAGARLGIAVGLQRKLPLLESFMILFADTAADDELLDVPGAADVDDDPFASDEASADDPADAPGAHLLPTAAGGRRADGAPKHTLAAAPTGLLPRLAGLGSRLGLRAGGPRPKSKAAATRAAAGPGDAEVRSPGPRANAKA